MDMDTKARTVTGKDRYKSGVLEYRKMGYWEPDYVVKDTNVLAMFRITPRNPASTRSRRPRRSRAKAPPRPGRWSGRIG
jgi:hypothetical protein